MSIGWFMLGAASWTVSEYAIHRFVGHGHKRTPARTLRERISLRGLAAEFNREHLAHHADASYFAPTERKLLAAGVAVPTIASALLPFVGLRRAACLALGFTAMYGAYEVMHRRIHTHPPKGPYGRWARRHHLYHHYKSPRQNHGVTSSIWDHAFQTFTSPGHIRVPRRSAPGWMVGSDGELRAEYRRDYELAGTGRATVAVDPAVANLA